MNPPDAISPKQVFDAQGIHAAARQAAPAIAELRHDLHAHPQLAYEETYAAERVQEALAEAGIPFEAGVAETGVVGWLRRDDQADRPAVLLRADMDALPITEETGVPYASQTPGRMHACGHDGHTAALVGAARLLAQWRDDLPHPVKFLFQPAEEGGAGAERMIRQGALGLGGPTGCAFGLHGWPALPLGTAATRTGPFLAATDSFRITLRGLGGHAAMPDQTLDPAPAMAALVSALHTVVSRNVPPADQAVISVTQAHLGSGEAVNIIPPSAWVAGTLRTVSPETRERTQDRVRTLAQGVAEAFEVEADAVIDDGYPAVLNHPALTGVAQEVHRGLLGDDASITVPSPVMGGEDFAYLAQAVPSNFTMIGLARPNEPSPPGLHHPAFDFNDDALPVAMALHCGYALHADPERWAQPINHSR
ncbi:MAG: amidohydrolase [Planctomycetota bacterium]